jgi:ATP-dependent RNA helicase DDX49/DBP8
MATDYSSSGDSDEDMMKAQMGSRKRRKTSSDTSDSEMQAKTAPASTISRVKPAKATQPAPKAVDPASNQGNSKDKVSFASLNVAPWLVASLASMEIKRPTGIQKACIPEILKGHDCIGGSRTGTGKTVAFSVPILQKWAEDPSGIFGLIVT